MLTMFTMCATTLASNILQVSLGTSHYLCGGSGEGNIEGGQGYFRLSRGGGPKRFHKEV